MSDDQQARQQHRRTMLREDDRRSVDIFSDLLKHFATLSLAAIALIAGFLDSLVKAGNNFLTIFAITTSFFICIIAYATSYASVAIESARRRRLSTEKWYHFANITKWVAIVSFFVGVTCLYIFILTNIFFRPT